MSNVFITIFVACLNELKKHERWYRCLFNSWLINCISCDFVYFKKMETENACKTAKAFKTANAFKTGRG